MKFFNTKTLTKKELRKSICAFAKEAGVNKVIFNASGRNVSGTYHSHQKYLYLNLKQTKQQMLRTFFHELGHHEAATNNKWVGFHFKFKKMKIETIFNIENKIDQIGKKLWYKNVDLKQWGMYKYFYPKSSKNNYVNNLSKQ